MLLTLFNIFLSIIELCQLVLVVNQELFRIIKRALIAPERKSVKNETVLVTGRLDRTSQSGDSQPVGRLVSILADQTVERNHCGPPKLNWPCQSCSRN